MLDRFRAQKAREPPFLAQDVLRSFFRRRALGRALSRREGCDTKSSSRRRRTRPNPDLMYAWPRYWVPSDGIIDLSDAGCLRDPTVGLADRRHQRNWQRSRTGRRSPCWANQGMGKSTTLKEEADRIAALPADGDAVSIYVDLRAFSSETLLSISKSSKARSLSLGKTVHRTCSFIWTALTKRCSGSTRLPICWLPNCPKSRRSACRSVSLVARRSGPPTRWEPRYNIWGDGSGVFQLAPLRRRDVVSALDANEIAVEDFMRALFAAQAVPFAIKPLTLKMLLSVYQRPGQLPKSNLDLYKQGCLALTKEQNKSRRNSGAWAGSIRNNACAWRDGSLPRPFLATALRFGRDRRSTARKRAFRYPRLPAAANRATSLHLRRPMTMFAKCYEHGPVQLARWKPMWLGPSKLW